MKNVVDKYTYRVEWSEEDQTHIARCLELPSLTADSSSPEKAILELKKVVKASLKWMKEDGEAVPEPLGQRPYSGQFNVRIPKDLHRKLVMQAADQHVSLNQLVIAYLAREN